MHKDEKSRIDALVLESSCAFSKLHFGDHVHGISSVIK